MGAKSCSLNCKKCALSSSPATGADLIISCPETESVRVRHKEKLGALLLLFRACLWLGDWRRLFGVQLRFESSCFRERARWCPRMRSSARADSSAWCTERSLKRSEAAAFRVQGCGRCGFPDTCERSGRKRFRAATICTRSNSRRTPGSRRFAREPF